MGQRVAVYTRLSKDESGQQTATARQEVACRATAEARGWEVVEVFTDVDLSAYRADVARPGYEQLLTAVDHAQVDGVLVWKLDRLVRRPAEFERFWARLEAHGGFLASATEPIDSSTELGLVIVRVLVAFASLESATMGLRLRAQKREAAHRGAPPSGQRRFGHTAGYTALVEDEAELLREAARRVLAGESLRSIVLEWNAAGIRTPGGKPWKAQSLRLALLAPRTRGMRTYHGQIVAQGAWPAILDPDTAAQLDDLFADPARRRQVRAARTSLLAGVLRCGKCGGPVRAATRNRKPAYACPAPPEGCAGVATLRAPLDELITRAVIDRVDGPQLAALLHPGDDDLAGLVDDVARLESSLEQLAADHYADGVLTRPEYLAARTTVERRLDTARRQLARRRRAGALDVLDGQPLARLWPDLTALQRNAVITAVVDHVVVAPVGRSSRFRPDRFTITWA